MKLVKTKSDDGRGRTCLINESGSDSEFTACGIACDSTFEYENYIWIDKPPAKTVTCVDCINVIKFYKSIKL